MTTTFEKIRAIIVRDFELPPERLQHDTLLQEIELDSLSITELVFAIEDEFQITAESTIPPFKTLGDIADYVARLIAERDAKPRAAEKAAEAAAVPTPSKRARGGKPAGQLAPTTGGASSEPSKRSHRARKANGKAETHAKGRGRANGASGDHATHAKSARGAKQPTRSASAAPSSKPQRSGGNRAGARIR